MNYKIEKHSGLKYIEKENSKGHQVFVFLHGYGANAMDLFPISHLEYFPQARWIFIEAPLTSPEIADSGERAWFHLDITHFQTLIVEKRFDEFYNRNPKGIKIVHDQLSTFLNRLCISPEELVLGGFSQGAITVTDFIFTKQIVPQALVFFSGTIINYENWKQQNLTDLPIFQSHGCDDETLPLEGAQKFKDLSNSKNHQFEIFKGGHEIPPQILKKCADFLKAL